MGNIVLKNKKGILNSVFVINISMVIMLMIASYTIWGIRLQQAVKDEDIVPLGMSLAQDRINDILNKNFYDNYKKAQSKTVLSSIKNSDGQTIYVGDKYNVVTEFHSAGSCHGQLCYQATVRIQEKDTKKELYSATETILESQSGRGVPVGTILPFAGNLSELPYGWEIYKPMNQKYSKGAVNSSDLGKTGGQNTFQLSEKVMPEYSMSFQFDRPLANGVYDVNGQSFGKQSGAYIVDVDEDVESRWIQFGKISFVANIEEWKGIPFSMEPSFYQVAYIIKTKETN